MRDAVQLDLVMPRRPRVLSLGGGLDSFAMLVHSIKLGEPPDVVVFIDVGAPGDPGEWAGTYRHIREVVIPLCETHGIRFVWIDGETYPVRNARSLFAWLYERKQIPVAGPNRICTTVAKVERFERWLDDTCPDRDVEVWIGFEAGEEKRAAKDPNSGKPRKRRPGQARRINRFPLIEWGFCRCRCVALVRAAGHPVPRKSACMFCPYGTRADWRTLAEEEPAVFEQVADLEERKPPTAKNGLKLSIMLYDSRKQRGTPLRQYVASSGRPRPPAPCKVCGAAEKATKATGCDYLEAA
jgi:hypothetical protein